jgi:D-citramalate synthase
MVNKPQEFFSAVEKPTRYWKRINVDLNRNRLCACKRREFQGVKGIWFKEHQRIRNRIEVLTFVDGGLSIEWMKKQG